MPKDNQKRIVSFLSRRMKCEITIVKDIVKREHTIIEALNRFCTILKNIFGNTTI